MITSQLSSQEKKQFKSLGFLIKRQLVDTTTIAELRQHALADLQNRVEPFELEAQVHYPGAPDNLRAKGGDTIRRLRLAYTRGHCFMRWAENQPVCTITRSLLDTERLFLSQSHHNCIMTKQPHYSSETSWHKDVRYWHFNNDELVNTWLALGSEHEGNGCLRILPGSHLWQPDNQQLDEALFLKKNWPENQSWLDKAISIELEAGDVLFFHAASFHSADRNQSDQPKIALVLTYYGEKTYPLPETSSSHWAEIEINPCD